MKQQKSGFLGKLLGGKQEDYDLDAVAFLLDSNGKVANLGDKLIGGDVIFTTAPNIHPVKPGLPAITEPAPVMAMMSNWCLNWIHSMHALKRSYS
ncbi:hypothetical protein [Paraflavitalea speifideaquila]|uniref:hypothetical protein n=1 Tax=Paraflavitalea speifideaquila TaxID=3076558 RepID=UPI003312FB80